MALAGTATIGGGIADFSKITGVNDTFAGWVARMKVRFKTLPAPATFLPVGAAGAGRVLKRTFMRATQPAKVSLTPVILLKSAMPPPMVAVPARATRRASGMEDLSTIGSKWARRRSRAGSSLARL